MIAAHEEYFLRSFFQALNTLDVPYAVLRNYEHLPASTGGSDIDIAVEIDDVPRISEVIRRTAAASGGQVIGECTSLGHVKVCVLGPSNEDWWGVTIDLLCEQAYRGLRFAGSVPELPVSSWNGIRVLKAPAAASLAAMKELLHNKRVPERYLEPAQRAVLENEVCVARTFRPLSGTAINSYKASLRIESGAELGRAAGRLRREIAVSAYLLAPFDTVKRQLGHQFSRVRRYFRPSGFLVAVLGVDGVGKSTLIDSITPALRAAVHDGVRTYHLRPSMLPRLSKVFRRQEESPVTQPHALAASGLAGSIARLLYLLLDYVVGYWICIRPQLSRQPAVVLFDRYAFDLLLDPRRFRIDLPNWMLEVALSVVPKPDLVICLTGSPDQIAARKNELSLAETLRQVAALERLAARVPSAVLLDTRSGVVAIRDRVLQEIATLGRRRVSG